MRSMGGRRRVSESRLGKARAVRAWYIGAGISFVRYVGTEMHSEWNRNCIVF